MECVHFRKRAPIAERSGMAAEIALRNGVKPPVPPAEPTRPVAGGPNMAKKPADDTTGVWEIVRNAVYFVRNAGTLGLAFCVLYVVREQLQNAGPPLLQAFVTSTETNRMLVPLLKERIESSAEIKASIDNLIIVDSQILDEMKSQRKGRP